MHCTLYSVQCTVYTVKFTVYSVQCTVYSVQCTVYSVQFTAYSVVHKHTDTLHYVSVQISLNALHSELPKYEIPPKISLYRR